jgi:hypothetical protein
MATTRDPSRTARYILQQAGMAAPRTPPIDELATLAHAYLDGAPAAPASATDERDRLADGDVLYVSDAAARQFADAERIVSVEQARRRLTELLIDATQHRDDLSRWRARSRSSALDITARVAIEGRLLVVTHVEVRPLRSSGGDPDRPSRRRG